MEITNNKHAVSNGLNKHKLDFNAKPLHDLLKNIDSLDTDELVKNIVNCNITGFGFDYKNTQQGYIFVAMVGNTNRELFINEATNNGAVVIIKQAENQTKIYSKDKIIYLELVDIMASLGSMLNNFYGNINAKIALHGITGTNGKTSVCWLLAQLLDTGGDDYACAVIGTLGFGAIDKLHSTNNMTTPDILHLYKILADLYEQKYNHVAMEVSAHGISQQRIANLKFTSTIFTNATTDHLDYYSKLDDYHQAKSKLFSNYNSDCAIINIDDEQGKKIYKQSIASKNNIKKTLSYALHNPKADLYATTVKPSNAGMVAEIATPWGNATCRLNFLGDYNILNLLATMAVALNQGMNIKTIEQQSINLKLPAGRMQIINLPNNVDVIVDFAHTPNALEELLIQVKKYIKKPVTVVFGCGGNRDSSKRSLMGKIAVDLADSVVLTSDNPRLENPNAIIEQINAGVKLSKNKAIVAVESDRTKAIQQAIMSAYKQTNAVVVIAGKGHEDYQEIGNKKIPFSDIDIVETCKQNV